MKQTITGAELKNIEIAARIRELREISGISQEQMAAQTGVSLETYRRCEEGAQDLNIAFLYRCVLILGVDMSDLLEGHSPKLRSYALTRKGEGQRIEEAHHVVRLFNALTFALAGQRVGAQLGAVTFQKVTKVDAEA